MARRDINQQVWDDFAKLTKDEQRAQILSIAERCIDGAPVGLARRIEIYFKDGHGQN
jgi:hypothetical protein